MTKSILKSILAGAAFVAGSFLTNDVVAQNGAVNSAEFYILPENANYEKALDKIRQATFHDKTKDKAKTWYVRAKVFTSILQAGIEDEKVAALVDNPADSAFVSMKKVKEIEKAEGEDKYTDMLENLSSEGVNVQQSLESQLKNAILSDVQTYQDTDFERAYKAVVPLVEYFGKDTTLLTYAGYFANKAEDYDRAGYYFEQLGDLEEYNSSDGYQSSAAAYYKLGDTTKLLHVLEKGSKRYPEESYFVLVASDIYVKQQKYEEAIEALEKANKLDSQNVQQLTILARLSNELERTENAYKYYEKIYEIEGDNEEAVRALGVGYYQIAGDLYRQLDEEAKKSKTKKIDKEDERYKRMITYVDKSIPYLMVYKDLADNKSAVYSTLMNLYIYKGDDAKADEMEKLAEKSKTE